jgi:hypothetical protein
MNNRNTMILLGIIAVLLVAVIGVVVAGNQKPAATVAPTAATGQPTANGAPSGMGGQPSGPVGPPTKVPAGLAVDKYVSTYYSSILSGDFAKAWGMQPAANKAQGDAAAFKATQQGYGLKAFKVLSVEPKGNTTVCRVQQDLGTNGKWVSVWTFDKSGSTWVASSKKTSMQ